MTKQEILTEVENAFLIAEKFYNRKFNRPNVIFKRNGTCAGFATRDCKTLMYQLDLAEAHSSDFIQTVKHEVAHNIQFSLYPRSQGHGREWKYIMQYVMRIPADRCHSYDTSVTKTRQVKYFDYTCKCGNDFQISSTMHNKIQHGLSNPVKMLDTRTFTYILKAPNARNCRRCKGNIFLKSDTAENLLKQMAEIQNKINAQKV